MTDADALLAAIIADPDDDTPRLAYADWLDENGDPDRAEFIRLQCASGLDEARKGRAFELEQWYRSKWLSGFPQSYSLDWEFRRGFPECLTAYCWPFLARFEVVAGVVWVRSLSLTGVNAAHTQDFVGRLWNRQWIELELQALAVHGGFQAANESTPSVAAVANCPQIAQLRLLRFSLFEMNADGIRALAASPYLNHIQQLRLDCVTDQPALTPLRARFGNRLVIG